MDLIKHTAQTLTCQPYKNTLYRSGTKINRPSDIYDDLTKRYLRYGKASPYVTHNIHKWLRYLYCSC
jgi:hypothetical protein